MWAAIKNLFVKPKSINIKEDNHLLYYDMLNDKLVLVKPYRYAGISAFVYQSSDHKESYAILFDDPEFFDFIFIDNFN